MADPTEGPTQGEHVSGEGRCDDPATGTTTGDFYDRYWSTGIGGWHPAAGLSAELSSALQRTCDQRSVLDYGGGDGRRYGDCIRIAARRYVVADVSPAVLSARRELGDEAINLSELDQLDGQVDTLVMLEVLEHLLDPAAALKAATDLLPPGGLALVSVPNAFSWWNRLRMVAGRLPASGVGPPGVRGHTYDAPHIRFFDLTSFTHLIEHAGLVVDAVWTDELDLGRLSRLSSTKRRVVSRRNALFVPTFIAECRKP